MVWYVMSKRSLGIRNTTNQFAPSNQFEIRERVKKSENKTRVSERKKKNTNERARKTREKVPQGELDKTGVDERRLQKTGEKGRRGCAHPLGARAK